MNPEPASSEVSMLAPRDRALILVADDDLVIRSNLSLLLSSEGYRVREAADGTAAGRILADPALALALLDLMMPGRGGLDLLREHQERLEDVPVIVITALGGSAAAIEAMKLGAFDFITKPFDLDEILFTVRRALTQKALIAQVHALSAAQGPDDDAPEELIGHTPAMVQVFKTIGRVAATAETVLILGESGTGKELVANAIHANSDRAERPFIKVNCAALSPTLLESELFGHEKGAFTGAVALRRGRFEQANGGTLFLDEVGDLDVELQAKLLRVLQTGQFERVGGNETLQGDVRVVSATHRDLPALCAEGKFREDLYYRLNVVTIELPPLRARREDIPLLAEAIVRRLANKYRWPRLGLTPEAVQALAAQPWPGNVRQLQNVLARAALLARGRPIGAEDVQPAPSLPAEEPAEVRPGPLALKEILAETERRVIQQALEQESWNRTRAARVLGISRRQLFDKIQQYGLQK
jgi:two-component system, NtrC family, response regulator AtoC